MVVWSVIPQAETSAAGPENSTVRTSRERNTAWPKPVATSGVQEKGTEETAQLVRCLPHTCEYLNLSLSTHIKNRCDCTHQKNGETEEEMGG